MRKQLLTVLTVTAMIAALMMMVLPAMANAETMTVPLTDSFSKTVIHEEMLQSGQIFKVQQATPPDTLTPTDTPPGDDTPPGNTTDTPPGDTTDTPPGDTTDTPPGDTTDTPGGSTSGGNKPDTSNKSRKTLAYTGGAANIFVSLGLVIIVLGAGLMARGAYRNKQEL